MPRGTSCPPTGFQPDPCALCHASRQFHSAYSAVQSGQASCHSPEKAPDKAEEVEIGFESGTPVSVNGKKLGPIELLNTLNEIAAKHGIGRTDLVENRLVGMKSRGAYE